MGSDLAETHNPQHLFIKLVADIFFAVPSALTHGGVSLGHMAGEREQQGQGMLSSSNGVALRRIHHQHATLRGSGHINVVHPHTGAPHDPELVCGGNDIGGHLGARANHQCVVLADDRFQLFRAEACALIDLSHLTQDVDAGLINGIGNQNFCHQPAKDSRRPL